MIRDVRTRVRRALMEAGYGDPIIHRAVTLAGDQSKWRVRRGVGLTSLAVGLALTQLQAETIQPSFDLPSWLIVLLILALCFAGLGLFLYPHLSRPRSERQATRIQVETEALSYLIGLALDADGDRQGDGKRMLRNFAIRLNAVPEAAQIDELVSALDMKPDAQHGGAMKALGAAAALIALSALIFWLMMRG
jgi:hypothetical protein